MGKGKRDKSFKPYMVRISLLTKNPMGNLFVATTTRPYDDNNELDTYVEYM